jgi:hypothetical protein
LSWFLLKQEIQTAEHDSIEDARCALQLYKKYRTFLEENRFEDVMEDIFDAGQRLVRAAYRLTELLKLIFPEIGIQTAANAGKSAWNQYAPFNTRASRCIPPSY